MKITLKGINTALRNTCNHSFGRCNICGNYTLFLCRDVAIARNDMICLFCCSSSRNRHVASLVISRLFNGISSIAEISEVNSDIHIYNMAAHSVFSTYLSNYPNYCASDYFPDVPPGQLLREKLYCQNVECLTFESASFDLVLSEDVFEHVRDYRKGFSEISRVLKPGGYHIFTVPCFFDKKTLIRVDTSGEEDVFLLPPEYHGDSVRGQILAYRTFGLDIFDILSGYGFNTEVYFSRYIDKKIGAFDSFVFVSSKVL